MPFPQSERVIYGKNPLKQVICQLRYPVILKISNESPVTLQDEIRGELPIYAESTGIGASEGIPDELVRFLSTQMPSEKSYDFSTEDSRWVFTLNKNFIALTCNHYERWEDFKRKLHFPMDQFVAQYLPNFWTRIGLRYVNKIDKDELGIPEKSWKDLIVREYLGEAGVDALAERIVSTQKEIKIKLIDPPGEVMVRHGLLENKDRSRIYVVDADFYTNEKTEIENAFQILDSYHEKARRLFRSIIKDELHVAMEPRTLEGSDG